MADLFNEDFQEFVQSLNIYNIQEDIKTKMI